MQRLLTILLAVTLCIVSGLSSAKTIEQSITVLDSRYVNAQAVPEPGQRDLLSNIVELEFPDQIHNVGRALKFVLEHYGFRLADCQTVIQEQYLLFMLPLPSPHRQLGPVTLSDALSILGGKGFVHSVNPVNRTVCYQLREEYQHYVDAFDIETARRQWLALKESTSLRVEEISEQSPSESYGPVKPGENLSSIANQILISGITLDQLLVHLFNSNPQAFFNGNMNALSAGAVLVIQSLEHAKVVSEREASEIVDEHYRLWIEQKVNQ